MSIYSIRFALLMIWILWHLPQPRSLQWPTMILISAVTILVPLGVQLIKRVDGRFVPNLWWMWLHRLSLPAALLFVIAYFLPQGVAAGWLVIPWLLWSITLTFLGVYIVWRADQRSPDRLIRAAGMIFLSVGGVWALFDRFGLRPLDFDPIIVLMTAVHFHFAGFLLPLLAGLAARERPAGTATLTGWLVIIAIPLTAAGITITQLGWGKGVETAAALCMAAGGLLTGWLHLRLAANTEFRPAARLLWTITGVCLLLSMTLAALYGLRVVFPLMWLNLPLMWIVHGSANAVGVGVTGVWGWMRSIESAESSVKSPEWVEPD